MEVSKHHVLLQRLVHLSGYGYWYWTLIVYPERKRGAFDEIDAKLMDKYPALQCARWQAARRKKKGMLNAAHVRFDSYCVLLHTDGNDDCGLTDEETFRDSRSQRLVLPGLYKYLDFSIHREDGSYTCGLDKRCYKDLQTYLQQQARKRPLGEVLSEWRELDYAIPAWRRAIVQKERLRKCIVQGARQGGAKLASSDVPVTKARKQQRVG